MERKILDKDCPVRKSMQIFAGKWTLLIIFQINRRTIRYGELKRAIPNISEKMLIDELKFLCNKGLASPLLQRNFNSSISIFSLMLGIARLSSP